MTKKTTNSSVDQTTEVFQKLSIQVSLNGLSFCILDTIGNVIINAKNVVFEKEQTPAELLNRLKALLASHIIDDQKFNEVVIIHRNSMFSLVPKSLFNPDELVNYLKFNAKILAHDHIVHDEVQNFDIVNVYVPFANINNFIFDLFGEFEFQHQATIMIDSLLNEQVGTKDTVCYTNVGHRQMDILIVSQKELLFYNSFDFSTKEDFVYYLLFSMEQLKLDPQTILLKLFGAIEEGDEIYKSCYRYVKNVSIFMPSKNDYPIFEHDEGRIDFTILSTL